MGKISWKGHGKKAEAGPKELSKAGDLDKIMPIAKEIEEAMGGYLIAIYRDSRTPDTYSVVISETETGSMNVVRVPDGAKSIEDAEEDADHFCSGIELARELLRDGGIKPGEPNTEKLIGALSASDRALSLRLATGWVRLLVEFSPVSKKK